MGPRLSSLMASATSAITGASAIRAVADTVLSNSHFITTSQSVIGWSSTSSTGTLPRYE